MNILIINGPNLNMLGYRESIYGSFTYAQMNQEIIEKHSNHSFEIFQSNSEGEIIDKIHYSLNYDCLIINAGAYTHYSYAIYDALLIFKKPIIEVHLTTTMEREEFRKVSVIRPAVDFVFEGHGIGSYHMAIKKLEELC